MTDFATALELYLPEPKKENKALCFTLVKTPKQYDKAAKNLSDDCTIYCRTLDGSPCASTKCVGYCWSKIHKGYITKNLMAQHQCIEKNCKSFQKIPEASYWVSKEAKAQERKTGKQLKKFIAAEEAAFLQEIRDITIHDYNFYPVAAELKDDTFNVRIINFEPIDYSHYSALFSSAADGRKIHFTKIKTNKERKQLIIEKHNIIKVAAPAEPENFSLFVFVKDKVSAIIKFIKSLPLRTGGTYGKRQ